MIFLVIFGFHASFLYNFGFLFCLLVEVGFLVYLKLVNLLKRGGLED
jgi:hypothetical protein